MKENKPILTNQDVIDKLREDVAAWHSREAIGANQELLDSMLKDGAISTCTFFGETGYRINQSYEPPSPHLFTKRLNQKQ